MRARIAIFALMVKASLQSSLYLYWREARAFRKRKAMTSPPEQRKGMDCPAHEGFAISAPWFRVSMAAFCA
ncbi:MAG TPA: hypothetical protein VJP60_07900 [Rhizomicrobium sp.]|nr:hypothetical protein [Rhizomicrobium sp.]